MRGQIEEQRGNAAAARELYNKGVSLAGEAPKIKKNNNMPYYFSKYSSKRTPTPFHCGCFFLALRRSRGS